jgi:RTA1 like protein
MLLEFIAFSTFSIVVVQFGWRYRQHKEEITEPGVRVPIVDRIMLSLYLNVGGQFVRAIFRVCEFSEFVNGVFIIPEVYLYLFDALPILVCTLALSILLPWELDYQKAVGDVVEKVEWGLLAPIVYPMKILVRRQREKRRLKKQQLIGETDDTQELSDVPKLSA